MEAKSVTVVAPARIHFGLVALTNESARAYGGAGLAVWHRRTVVTARTSVGSEIKIRGAPDGTAELIAARLAKAGLNGLSLDVCEYIEPHIGLGSHTSLLLACVEAAMRLGSGRSDPDQIQRVSGRGGASGVGINAYFLGGLIGDAGRCIDEISTFWPSSAAVPRKPPKVIYRVDWPVDWRVTLLCMVDRVGIYGEKEVEFFERVTPISREEAALSALALHTELPGCVLDHDFSGLRQCLRQSCLVGFKAHELSLHTHAATLLATLSRLPEVAASMSSMGPSVAVISRSELDMTRILGSSENKDRWRVLKGSVCLMGREVLAE